MSTIFDDPLACIFDDKWNSFREQRELIIGYSNDKWLLIVSFTERFPGVIRVIGARQTTTRGHLEKFKVAVRGKDAPLVFKHLHA